MTTKDTLAVAVGACTLIGLVYAGARFSKGQVEAWAQAAVEEQVGKQQATLDLIVCTTVYQRPLSVCQCELFESMQAVPRPERCATAERLIEAGRPEEAAAVVADSIP